MKFYNWNVEVKKQGPKMQKKTWGTKLNFFTTFEQCKREKVLFYNLQECEREWNRWRVESHNLWAYLLININVNVNLG
jgi:pantothenate kinase